METVHRPLHTPLMRPRPQTLTEPARPQTLAEQPDPNSVDPNQEALRIARELLRQDPDWVTFFREILGLDGVVRRLFPSHAELTKFETSAEYNEIQQVLVKLRGRAAVPGDPREPTQMITVRLPQSLHQSLRNEAQERGTSMNKLCISKLLQVIADEMIPVE